MKKFSAVSLIVIFYFGYAFSQTAATDDTEWRPFTAGGEEFVVEMPGALDSSEVFEKNLNRRHTGRFGEKYFYIFSDKLKKPVQYEFVAGLLKAVEARQKSPLIRKTISFGGVPGEKIFFSEKDYFHHTIVLVKTYGRAYVFHAVSPERDDPVVERFFASLKINGRNAPDQSLEVSAAASAHNVFINENDAADEPGEIKAGAADATAPSVPVPADPSGPTRDLRILAKARAYYTDVARFYELSGRVSLIVTFLPSGRVGTVTPRQKLPLGLTDRAVEAARKLAFEPALRQGVAVAVAKTVEYQFTVY